MTNKLTLGILPFAFLIACALLQVKHGSAACLYNLVSNPENNFTELGLGENIWSLIYNSILDHKRQQTKEDPASDSITTAALKLLKYFQTTKGSCDENQITTNDQLKTTILEGYRIIRHSSENSEESVNLSEKNERKKYSQNGSENKNNGKVPASNAANDLANDDESEEDMTDEESSREIANGDGENKPPIGRKLQTNSDENKSIEENADKKPFPMGRSITLGKPGESDHVDTSTEEESPEEETTKATVQRKERLPKRTTTDTSVAWENPVGVGYTEAPASQEEESTSEEESAECCSQEITQIAERPSQNLKQSSESIKPARTRTTTTAATTVINRKKHRKVLKSGARSSNNKKVRKGRRRGKNRAWKSNEMSDSNNATVDTARKLGKKILKEEKAVREESLEGPLFGEWKENGKRTRKRIIQKNRVVDPSKNTNIGGNVLANEGLPSSSSLTHAQEKLPSTIVNAEEVAMKGESASK